MTKRLDATFKALSDPTRREILRLLAKGDLTAGRIADNFEITKPSVSHHLSVLRAAGFVSDERRGQNIVYSLETSVVQDVLAWVIGVSRNGSGERHEGDRANS